MNQLGLDFSNTPCDRTAPGRKAEPARARRSDPQTSQRSAHGVRIFVAGHYALILDAIGEGGTYKEIAERCGLEQHAVARRLGELEKIGKVYRKEIGRTEKGAAIHVSMNGCALWWLA